MQLFEGNDAFLTTEHICKSLRSIAEDEAKEGEYHPAEHINWIAADAIERLVEMIDKKHLVASLKEAIRRIENG